MRQHSTRVPPPASPCRTDVLLDAGDGGVIKTIVTEGSGWAKPQSMDEVCVR